MSPQLPKPKDLLSKVRAAEAREKALNNELWQLRQDYFDLKYQVDDDELAKSERERSYQGLEWELELAVQGGADKDAEIKRLKSENAENLAQALSEKSRNETLVIQLSEARATAAYLQARVTFLQSDPATSVRSDETIEHIAGSEVETPKLHRFKASVSENSSVATEMHHAELPTTAEGRVLAHRQRAAVILRLCDCLDAVAKIDDEIHAGAVGESLSEEVESFVRSIRRQAGRIAREA